MGKYLLAHDLGTSGNKATLFSIEGQLIASCTYNYDVYYLVMKICVLLILSITFYILSKIGLDNKE